VVHIEDDDGRKGPRGGGFRGNFACVKESSPPPRHSRAGPEASNETRVTEHLKTARMTRTTAEEYIASLYSTILKRDPQPDEFAHWVTSAATLPPEEVYFAFVKSAEYKLQQEKCIDATIQPAAPAHLRKRVNGDENIQLFESMGRTVAANVFGQLMRVGPYIDNFKIFDFGVGCGRVIRPLHQLCIDSHLTDSKLRWFGSDIDDEAIGWCRSAIESIGTFVVNSHMPPLPFDDQYFDFVYSTSIFTHLPEDMQYAWLSDLRRVMRIGSFAVLSTHPTSLMPAFLRETLPNPGFYYHIGQDTEGLPSFYQVSFHSHEYIHKQWSEYFAIRKIIPNGIGKRQDLVLCQRVA
jgi:ubiquinone/menaquinone biosynthesis C-methylase UbiE